MYVLMVIIIILSGCVDQINNQLKFSAQNYKTLSESYNISVKYDKASVEYIMKEAKKLYELRENGSLYAVVCNYSKMSKVGWDKFKAYWKYLLGDKKALFDETLIGGKCWVQNVSHYPSFEAIIASPYLSAKEIKNNTAFYRVKLNDAGDVEIEDISKLSDKEIEERYKLFDRFMFYGVGAGPSFSDFNELNPYCNNSLRYPIKFISGTPTQYLLPAAPDLRAVCYLDLGYIPVYVFYSKYGVPEVDNSALLVAKLSSAVTGQAGTQVGPVILFTEGSIRPDELLEGLKLNGNSKYTGRIYAQIISWKVLCPDCMVGLSIPFDINTEQLIKLKEIITSDNFLYENISLMGFGIDVDKLSDKDSFAELIYRMDNLLRFGRDLGKPTAIYYIYIPQDWLGKRIRPDGFRYSNFDYLMKTLYSTGGLGTVSIASMISNGMIMLPSPPLVPESMIILLGKNSPASVMSSDFNDFQPVFSYVLSYCKEYFKVSQGYPVIFTDSGVDIRHLSISTRTGYYKDDPDYREPEYNPPNYYGINDKEDTIFKCVGCFLMLNSTEISKYKAIFSTSSFNRECNNPENIVKKIKFYSDILDLDPPFIRALIDELSNYNPNHVSFVDDPTEQIERCGHNLKYDDVKNYLPAGVQKKSDYVCGFGLMDVRANILKDTPIPCKEQKTILGRDIFDIDINLCKGIILLANASDKAEILLNSYSKYMTKYLDETYYIYRMMLTAMIYDRGLNFTEATVKYFGELLDELKIVGLTGIKVEDDKKCLDYDYLERFVQYCCEYTGGSNGTVGARMSNPYCVKLSQTEKYWDFLIGMKSASGFMYNNNPPYYDSFKNTYIKVERTLNITSKYFDAYKKCKDCADDSWADNALKKIDQICKNLPNLPMCK